MTGKEGSRRRGEDNEACEALPPADVPSDDLAHEGRQLRVLSLSMRLTQESRESLARTGKGHGSGTILCFMLLWELSADAFKFVTSSGSTLNLVANN